MLVEDEPCVVDDTLIMIQAEDEKFSQIRVIFKETKIALQHSKVFRICGW